MSKVKVKATKKKEEPIILVTNDDSYTAPGIHALVEAVKGFRKDYSSSTRQTTKWYGARYNYRRTFAIA
jgi:broad specificity polyphosphatase/5'/3'-nucleotidase SurE